MKIAPLRNARVCLSTMRRQTSHHPACGQPESGAPALSEKKRSEQQRPTNTTRRVSRRRGKIRGRLRRFSTRAGVSAIFFVTRKTAGPSRMLRSIRTVGLESNGSSIPEGDHFARIAASHASGAAPRSTGNRRANEHCADGKTHQRILIPIAARWRTPRSLPIRDCDPRRIRGASRRFPNKVFRRTAWRRGGGRRRREGSRCR